MRINFDLDPQQKNDLEILCRATGLTQKKLLVEAMYMVIDHIKRSQRGYQRVYIRIGDPSQKEYLVHSFDRVKLPDDS